MRRDRGRARHRRGRDPGERRLLAGRPARALRRASCRRSPRGGISSSSSRSSARRSPSAGASLDDVDRVAVTQGPGLIGALLVGVSAAKALAWARRLPLVPVNHLQGHVASLYLEPDPLEPPFVCLLASGGHTMLLDVREHGSFEVLGSTLDDAAGRGVRQGRAPARARLPGRRGDRPARARPAIPRRSRSPSPRARARLLVLRAQDRAALRRPRARRGGARAAAGRSRGELPARDRARARRPRSSRRPVRARSRSSAASPRTRSSAPRSRTPSFAPLALCTDNAAMIASAARFARAVPHPDYLGLDAFA